MSKSKRKPVIKEKPRNYKASSYYRRVRRIIKQKVKQMDEILPEAQEIVNDYDYCDYKFDLRTSKDIKQKKKYSRK